MRPDGEIDLARHRHGDLSDRGVGPREEERLAEQLVGSVELLVIGVVGLAERSRNVEIIGADDFGQQAGVVGDFPLVKSRTGVPKSVKVIDLIVAPPAASASRRLDAVADRRGAVDDRESVELVERKLIRQDRGDRYSDGPRTDGDRLDLADVRLDRIEIGLDARRRARDIESADDFVEKILIGCEICRSDNDGRAG